MIDSEPHFKLVTPTLLETRDVFCILLSERPLTGANTDYPEVSFVIHGTNSTTYYGGGVPKWWEVLKWWSLIKAIRSARTL